MELTSEQVKPIIESLLFISGDPLTLKQIKDIIDSNLEDKVLKQWLRELQDDLDNSGRGIQLIEIAHGYRLTSKPQFAPYIQKLVIAKQNLKLTKAAIETLAVIAYKQPLLRAEIEAIRGVDSGAVLQTLMERRLIKVVGRKEVLGRPLLYGTTTEFLDQFGLKNLNDLPTIDELMDDESENSGTEDLDIIDMEALKTIPSTVHPVESENNVNDAIESSEDEIDSASETNSIADSDMIDNQDKIESETDINEQSKPEIDSELSSDKETMSNE